MSSNKPQFGAVPSDSKAVIFALSGTELTGEERGFFKETRPLGFILFNKPGAKNIDNPEQVRALTDSLKECVGWDCPVLIDQEGGRVQRMRPPHWRDYPAAQVFGDQAGDDLDGALEALRFHTLRMADDLVDAGVNVTCSPCLDLLFEEAHDIIGDRSFGANPELAGRLGLSVARHYLAAGITPVIKHIPGHGRAMADSHLDLPVVKASRAELQDKDFKPFQVLASSEVGRAVWGMTAHIVYEALDTEHCATTSKTVIEDVIRREIGFDGFLLSDDLDMKALDVYGGLSSRADMCLGAGCDAVLHCSGDMVAMEQLAKTVPNLSAEARKRLQFGVDVV